MTTKEYLQQAYRLDKRINSHIKELGELKSMAAAISSPQITADKVQTTPSGDPPYVSALMRIWEMEEKINGQAMNLQIIIMIGNLLSYLKMDVGLEFIIWMLLNL